MAGHTVHSEVQFNAHPEAGDDKAGNSQDTAAKIGESNGRTTIGSSAQDTGNHFDAKNAEIMSRLGLNNFSVSTSDGANSQPPAPETKPEEHAEAQKKLDEQISKLLSPEDQNTLKGMQDALLKGDTKAFGEQIAKLQGDPERLKQFVEELNKNLQNSGSDTHATVDGNGNVILYNGSDTAVVFGKDGKASVHELHHRPDGSIVLGGEIIAGASADDAFKEIGNRTGEGISPDKEPDMGEGTGY